ncbi:MAG: DsbA family protein [Gammaproteobacteria bacterium]|jgi:predicted DsbA family dithiol-disulfide isomerase
MNTTPVVTVSHFSDVLCIWAYIAQIRVDELKNQFGKQIDIQYHFLPVFGAVDSMMETNWKSKGGLSAYNKHVVGVASGFDHVEVHKDVWLSNKPTTSISSHLFLKAIQLAESQNELTRLETGKTVLETFAWELRLAFFRDLKNISNGDVQIEIAEQLNLPIDKILNKIQSGEAHAAMDIDSQLKEEYQISGSPTFIFNEGRQKIYGNVGYRVIEANVRELINQPGSQASWC